MQGRGKGTLVGKTFSFPSLGPVNFYTLGEEGEKLPKLKEAHSVIQVAQPMVGKVINCRQKVGSSNIHLTLHFPAPLHPGPMTGPDQEAVSRSVLCHLGAKTLKEPVSNPPASPPLLWQS